MPIRLKFNILVGLYNLIFNLDWKRWLGQVITLGLLQILLGRQIY